MKNSLIVTGAWIAVFIVALFGGFYIYKYYIEKTIANMGEAQIKEVTAQDILLNYKLYAKTKQKLMISGRNGGWGEVQCDTNGVTLGMITQSDTLIYDDTGCIYVKGGLYPGMTSEYLNKRIKIEATVVLDENNKPVLEVVETISKEE